MKLLSITAVISLFIFQSCSIFKSKPEASAPLEGTQWDLMYINDGNVDETTQTVTISFKDNGQYAGFGGCNNYHGTYTRENATLALSPALSTKKACSTGMQTEQTFHHLLPSITSYEIQEGHLILKNKNGETKLKFVRKQP